MPRYIDADALLNELKEELEFDSPMYNEVENNWLKRGLRIARKDVKHFPSADVVPRSEVIDEFVSRLKERLYTVPTVYNSHFGRMVDAVAKDMKGGE